MQNWKIGNLGIAFLVGLNILLWLVLPPVNDGREHYAQQYIGEIFSTSALILISCGIFLASRARFLEPLFGGLDQMYQTHKTVAVTALLLLFAHFFTMSISGGFHLNVSLGKLALIGFITMAVLALAPSIPFIGGVIRLPYHTWKLTHRFVGIFLIIGLLHVYVLDALLKKAPVRFFVLPIAFAAVAVYLYKELFADYLNKKTPYRVTRARRLNGTTLEVTLKPIKERLSFKPGQFLFIGFPHEKQLKEPHPFTISSAPKSDELKLAIKASGDFTGRLVNQLEEGLEAKVEGAYGMFNYQNGADKQIWIAGGIGITPFLSWIRDFEETLSFQIDFYYTVRTPEEALYLDEIEHAQTNQRNFRAFIIYSNIDGRLTLETIVSNSGSLGGKEIFLCGPIAMSEALRKQFISSGVPAGKIHFEEFNFR